MKKATLKFDHYIELIETGHVKVGRYEYERSVDEYGDSHFRRYYRKGDEIISEEVKVY
jgi:hypothetical protein